MARTYMPVGLTAPYIACDPTESQLHEMCCRRLRKAPAASSCTTTTICRSDSACWQDLSGVLPGFRSHRSEARR